MKKSLQVWFLLAGLLLLSPACSEDSLEDPLPELPAPDGDGNEDDGDTPPDFTPVGTVEVFNASLLDDNYILFNDAAANRVFLMDQQARLLYEWELTNNIGNDVFLLPDGRLLASLESDTPQVPFGGKGGRLQFVAPDGTVE